MPSPNSSSTPHSVFRARARGALARGALACGVLAACGKPNDRGLDAASLPPNGRSPNGAASAGDVANPAMLQRATRWYPPGATDGNWLTTGRDYGMTRYSPLAEITPANVGRLKTALSFSTAVPHGHEATPLVAENTMYVVSPFPNRAYALDLTSRARPLKWTYPPNPSPTAIGKACCDAVNARRGAL